MNIIWNVLDIALCVVVLGYFYWLRRKLKTAREMADFWEDALNERIEHGKKFYIEQCEFFDARRGNEIKRLQKTVAKLRYLRRFGHIAGLDDLDKEVRKFLREHVAPDYLAQKWQRERKTGNWGKYLAREREAREKAGLTG
jgi:hypothetical protein